ncbi:glutathione peroxidase [Encephalitozoon intestinalis ATCC 50506]|uniref:Glutathione peroxidase n=1 Tax=Encephalitozoon intestinalis (strain ATCC 50506) TaxID=876142 RepID=E0S5Q3_ENCIT|nr:glutathione peroxidase [Encephalitozoon intestinalis ATCC 50506]ADM11038.1 glutathione peroxidase [Encephalitozoon intestinalis ATCC 50506]UTX44687.1 glutathione peroxidase [Encephalitozoon intestinalis]
MDQNLESQTFYNLSARGWNGEEVNFSVFRGCVLIIVNVASSCKLAEGNYKSFVGLLEKFYKKNLRILLFPCNQYLGQEPKPIERIHREVSEKYSDKFEVMDKVEVFGENAHPVFKHLTSTKNGKGTFGNFIKWNFTKFLVDRSGHVVKRFGPSNIIKEDEECLLNIIGDEGEEQSPLMG